ncbi:DUF4352 domain-containing protein [Enterococcus diestrammenae]|uniref:DUF4352 domain-containing protein n=1 Tax=Enterococcus diestrammenae TaxID=1155073 RepID=A0ABV0F5E6_9ENTE|nr:DUF4352 domain-containing protein [Enterococcus diestrammenae]KAF1299710.1 phage immunity protein [Enterococcus diestrammenae]
MAKKKVTGEDGKTYVMKEKKPFYKKIWFWILVVVVIAIGASSLGGGDKSNGGEKVSSAQSSEKKDTAESTKESETAEFYNVGDSVKVGDATYTLTSVSLTDERNQFDETNPAYVIAVSYTMENNSDEDLPVGMDLSAYGPDDKKLESYPNDNTMGSVAAGKKMDCVEHFGLGELGEVELQFAPAISLEKTANFKANVQ